MDEGNQYSAAEGEVGYVGDVLFSRGRSGRICVAISLNARWGMVRMDAGRLYRRD